MKHFFGDTVASRLFKSGRIFGAALFITLSLVLSSCPDPVDSGLFDNTKETGAFSLTIDTGGAGKTVLPLVSPADFDGYYFRLVFTPAASNDFDPVTEDRTKGNLSDAVVLPFGTWNLLVTAYKDEPRTLPVMEGASNGIVINNSPVTRSVTLKAISGPGEGTFKWNITLAGGVETAAMTIESENGTLPEINLLDTGNGSLTLNSGYYRLLFTIRKTGVQEVQWKEILHVYQNMESSFTFNFSDEYLNTTRHDVTFVYNNGQADGEITYLYGDTITKPADPTKPGYDFGGWYKDDDTFLEPWKFADEADADTVTADITLYAKWTSPITPSVDEIKASLEGGTGTIASPISLAITGHLGDLSQADGVWRGLLSVLAEAGDYVTLDISACTIEGTVFNHDNSSMVNGMDKIVDIILPVGVTSIGWYAFRGCTSLALTSLPAGITSIDQSAFFGCTSLALTSLPADITSIGQGAFNGCTNLALTSLPSSLTSIGQGAFDDCTSLALTSLPAGITSIGGFAFNGCTNLALTSLPAGITSIGGAAFQRCTNLALTSLPAGITSIGEYAFGYCTSLALTSLPAGLTSIGKSAFQGCRNLALTSLPAGITSIGERAFSQCANLALTSLPAGITSIGDNAFYGCTNLALTSLPAGITSIGDDAFDGCTNLALTSLPSGITSIGEYTFSQCANLALTSLPAGITSIGERAFNGCTNLALTSLPEGITSIGEYAFTSCTNLALTSLPEGITSIGSSAFYGCTNLALTSLPAGITSIGSHTFYGCTSLALTSLPAGITSIGDDAFYGCTNLALTSLPSGITSIGSQTFSGCTSLALTSLPVSVTSIGERAFYSCTSLAVITCLALTPPFLGSSALSNTHSSLQIKVPAESVDAYKAAPGWSNYAARISAIE